MTDRATQIFGSAQIYERAARCLNAASNQDPGLLMPSIINAALCLELYFKAAYILDKGVEFKINNRHSHDFCALFKELSRPIQTEMIAYFNKSMASRDMSDVRVIEKDFGVVVSLDLVENLSNWATCFTEFRYIHHFLERNGGEQKVMMFFPEIAQSVHGAVNRAIACRGP